jgi:uncharacterized membrane protein
MSELLRNGVLVAATVAMGLAAGLFYTFSVAVMPGLDRSDDRTFVEAMQNMNEAILNPLFALSFGGALVLTALAAVAHLSGDGRPALPWIVAALVLYGVGAFVVTITLNVPLNDELAEAGRPDRIADLAAVRERFETSWVRWNVVRALVSTAAFGCLTWALVLLGRGTAPGA